MNQSQQDDDSGEIQSTNIFTEPSKIQSVIVRGISWSGSPSPPSLPPRVIGVLAMDTGTVLLQYITTQFVTRTLSSFILEFEGLAQVLHHINYHIRTIALYRNETSVCP